MQFEELILKSFGKFKDKSIVLSDGINLIYGENEAGKSTIHTFLRGMLYGMERGRGRAALHDRFRKYEPWDNPNDYAGALRFRAGGRTFCLNRRFDKYSKGAYLFCEDDGEELDVAYGDLEILLGGLKESDYENTIGIGQNKALVGKELADEIKNFAANYCVAGDSDLDLGAALSYLKERKKVLQKEMEAQERRRQEKKEALELEASYVWRDIYHLEQEIEQEELRQKEAAEELQRLQQQIQSNGKKEGFERWSVHPVAILSMFGMVVLIAQVFEKPWNLICCTVALLAEIIYTWNKLKCRRPKEREEFVKNEEEQIREKAAKSKWNLEKLRENHKEKNTQYQNLKEAVEELEELDSVTEEQNRQKAAVELAEKTMKEVAEELQRSIGSRLNDVVSEIFSEITGGKYEKVWVDEQLQLSMVCEGRKVDMNQVSQGTLEQLHFALRMAAVRILYEEEYPVILDDTFAYYDDVRVGQVLEWLDKNVGQVLIFTCQKREEEILRKKGIPYHKVML